MNSRNVTRTSRRELVGIDEESLVSIARIEGEQATVDILLNALTVVARGQSAARSAGEKTSFDAFGLSVIGYILDNDAPLAFDVLGTDGTSVENLARADISITADPVALVESVAVVVRVVEMALLQRSDTVNQDIGRLVENICILLQHQRIVLDRVLSVKKNRR